MPAHPLEMCENCSVRGKDLRRCGGCQLVRYCSKECQKAHWKNHKTHCAINKAALIKAKSLGPDYSDRHTAIGKWSTDFITQIGMAASSAMDIFHHPERIGDSFLVIYVDFLGTTAKAPYTYDVVDAAVKSLESLRAHARKTLSPLLARDFMQINTPIPGMLRVLYFDCRVPWSYSADFVAPDAANLRRLRQFYDPLWFEHLQKSVTRPGQRVRPRETVQIDICSSMVNLPRVYVP
ncbi:hypothetical protein B0H11DRAFT_2082368 [Mycena galericulata]|nr:hypothetical protein B0H11DRAFT_2082368 [Mycena galericulata]